MAILIKNKTNKAINFQGTIINGFSEMKLDELTDRFKLYALLNSGKITYKIVEDIKVINAIETPTNPVPIVEDKKKTRSTKGTKNTKTKGDMLDATN